MKKNSNEAYDTVAGPVELISLRIKHFLLSFRNLSLSLYFVYLAISHYYKQINHIFIH